MTPRLLCPIGLYGGNNALPVTDILEYDVRPAPTTPSCARGRMRRGAHL